MSGDFVVAINYTMPTAASDMLDQNEVIRAMLAMAESKRAAESGSESESASDASDSGDESDGEVLPASPKISSRPMSAVATTSRVKLPPKVTPKGKAPSDVFDEAPIPADATFESLGLSEPIIRALASLNIRKPTEIQVASIPPILSGRDAIGGAKTGSGKTMAFALPILESLARDPFGIYAVVLTPTRELAYQLSEQFLAIGKPLGLTTATIVGGMDMLTQAQELERRPHVIVATPGRLCDLLRSDGVGIGKLSRVRTLVLDEADRMLTTTFAPELAFLFDQIPKNRQTLLFTATISDAIMDLAKRTPAPGKQKPFVYRIASE